MSDKKKRKPKAEAATPGAKSLKPPIGKRWEGQKHWPKTTPERVAALAEERAQYDKHPNAIPIDAYFAIRGHRDPVRKAAMKAYTNIERATVDVFDEIFATF